MNRSPHQIYHGDCIEVMRSMPGNSIDSIVTDPPYGLGFMGKAWDALPPGEDWARECLRVLKPGGHLLAFGGTRTWHRLAVAVEDAGFEIRDSIAWMYGSGFPKHRAGLKPAFEPIVMARKPFKGSVTTNEAIHGTGALSIDGCRIATDENLGGGANKAMTSDTRNAGWARPWMDDAEASAAAAARSRENTARAESLGRWPANVILDEHMAGVLDEQSGVLHSQATDQSERSQAVGATSFKSDKKQRISYGLDDRGASRFFYVAKAPKKERPIVDGIAHPTVKPLALMRWLVRLVTPTGGTVLDPFAGSGTTIEAAILEGFQVIGIEREAEYLPLIEARIERTAA